MRLLPDQDSRYMTILKTFLQHGPMTIYQGVEKHGEFPSLFHPQGIEHSKMEQLYCVMVDRNWLERAGIKYAITDRARKLLTEKLGLNGPRSVVPSRIRHFLNKPLFLGYQPRTPNIISL